MPFPARRSRSKFPPLSSPKTSWEPVSEWYGKQVGREGHYYHQHVVLPGLKKLLQLKEGSSLLDLACGNGVLAGQAPKGMYYQGFDISRSLVEQATQLHSAQNFRFGVADVSRDKLPLNKSDFSHGSIVLALQNIKNFANVFRHFQTHLADFGKLVVVLNHPSFRIPRQSGWIIHPTNKLQSRRVDRYMSTMEIPITAHPGQEKSSITWSFHYPLSAYIHELSKNGFVVSTIEEWVSDKMSEGKAAKMENRGRSEFPLFLTIVAHKLPAEVFRQIK